MVQEIALDNIGAFASYLGGPHLGLVIEAALAGNSVAQLWQISQPRGSALLLLWDRGNNVLYLGGELTDETARRELTDLIHTTIGPRSMQLERAYFKVRALTPSLEAGLEALFHGIPLLILVWFGATSWIR